MLPSGKALSQLLGGLYDAATDPDLWNPFLQQLAHSTGATSAGLIMLDVGKDVFAVSRSWEVDPEASRLYQEHYGSVDVWAKRALAKPAGYVSISEELCPLAEFVTTEIYNDFMVGCGVEHGMFGLMENTGSRLASVSLYRNSSCPEFGDREREILCFLAPHARRAFKLHLQFSELKARSAGIETTLDMLTTGVILLGAKSEIVLMNRSAAALVAEKDGLFATRDGLRAERQAESSLLAKTIQQATAASSSDEDSTPVGGTVLISRRTRPPLQILVSPIRNSTTISAISPTQLIAAIAFVIDPSQQRRPARDILRALFGLTPAECRVALLLCDGQAPKAIAETLGVSVETVRSQMKSIFSKTGVKRQSELVRLLLNNSALATGPQESAIRISGREAR